MPHVVGYQCAGTIREVGDGVTDRHVGQRVVAHQPLGLARRAARSCPRSSRGRCPTAPTSSRSRACRSRSAPRTTASSSSVTCRPGETVLIQAGAGGVGIAAIQLAKRGGRDGDRDRVERRPARAARRTSASTTASTTRTTTGSTRSARSPAGAASISSVDSVGGKILAGQRRVPGLPRPLHHASAARAAIRSRSTSGVLGMNNQSLTGVFLGAEITTPRAQAMIGALIDDVAAGRLHVEVDRTLPPRGSRRRPRLPREPPSRRPRRPDPLTPSEPA